MTWPPPCDGRHSAGCVCPTRHRGGPLDRATFRRLLAEGEEMRCAFLSSLAPVDPEAERIVDGYVARYEAGRTTRPIEPTPLPGEMDSLDGARR